ncbi:MAG: hypothetical protein GWO24_24580 [Akkermansiaceae bacterium]|nr:hypothetical protein [Akkermansiaceae bacterium]
MWGLAGREGALAREVDTLRRELRVAQARHRKFKRLRRDAMARNHVDQAFVRAEEARAEGAMQRWLERREAAWFD